MKQESRTKSKSSAIEQLLWMRTHKEDVISSFMASEADGRQSFTYFTTSNFQQIHVYLMTPNRTDGSHVPQTHGKMENRHAHTLTNTHRNDGGTIQTRTQDEGSNVI